MQGSKDEKYNYHDYLVDDLPLNWTGSIVLKLPCKELKSEHSDRAAMIAVMIWKHPQTYRWMTTF